MLLQDPGDVAVVGERGRRGGRPRPEVQFAPRRLGHRPQRLAARLQRVGRLQQVADRRRLAAVLHPVLVVERAAVDQRAVRGQEEDLRGRPRLQGPGDSLGRVMADRRAYARGRDLGADLVVRLGLHRVEHQQGDPAVGKFLFQPGERGHLPLAHRARRARQGDRHAGVPGSVGQTMRLTRQVGERDIRDLPSGQQGGGLRRAERQAEPRESEKWEQPAHRFTWPLSSWPCPPAADPGPPRGTSGSAGGRRPSWPPAP